MFEAGLILLPHPHDVDGKEPVDDTDPLEVDPVPVKPGIPTADLFDADDSYYDAPPDGFSLTVSVVNLTCLQFPVTLLASSFTLKCF